MLAKSISGAAAAVQPAFVEDVFSTYLYTGTGATRTITNGIDLSGKGGLVWVKRRDATGGTQAHRLDDTSRGAGWSLSSDSTNAQSFIAQIYQFNNNGFGVDTGGDAINASGGTYASWTFRKQAKFFDVVTYTGNGVAGRTVPHNLGSVPGCIIIKRTDISSNWAVYHRSTGSAKYLQLNTTNAAATDTTWWNNTTPSATTFTLGTATDVNASGGTYVAYLFAHNAGGFGLTGTDNVISCGSLTTTTSGDYSVTLGWEPQWLLVKRSDGGISNWWLLDTMRGMPISGNDAYLEANSANAELNSFDQADPTATGFTLKAISPSSTYIYIAIRRGPMKVPTSGTSVFDVETFTGGSSTKTLTSGFPADMTMLEYRSEWNYPIVASRLTGKAKLITNLTDAEDTTNTNWVVTDFDSNTGTVKYNDYSGGNLSTRSVTNGFVSWMFRRAPGFFDVVAYTGTGANRTVNHNLGVAPELVIVKQRNAAGNNWAVQAAPLGANSILILNTNEARIGDGSAFNSTLPTSSVFSLGVASAVNGSGSTYVAYLFASVPGVSKVGSYTGNGASQTINCSFTGGARFILIKRTDATGDWYVWDTARGIVTANDPHLSLNTTAAEVTTDDSIDTNSTGFIVNQVAATNINVSAATYIFLAIA